MPEDAIALRLTVVPAVVFLVYLPVFLLFRAKHAHAVLLVASVLCIYFVGGPILGNLLLLLNLGGYLLVEAVARLSKGNRGGFVLGLLLMHACYWACFWLPIPPPFDNPDIRPADAPSYFLLFSGIALTFFRLMTYFHARMRDAAPALSFADYLLFMLFYAQFRHGPIERAHDFVPRLRAARRNWSFRHLGIGLGRILVGLAAMVLAYIVIASRIPMVMGETGPAIAALYARPEEMSAAAIVALVHAPAVLLYVFESSYAHIQLGVSRAFGVVGSENFRYPFLARNPREIWQRWNITLFRWLRDYAYKPLRGSHATPLRRLLAVVLVFVYCGLLHAPQLRCVVWGLWTGLGVALWSWLAQRSSPRGTRGGWWPAIRGALARVVMWEWICISVTILADADHWGGRVLAAYGRALLGLVGLSGS